MELIPELIGKIDPTMMEMMEAAAKGLATTIGIFAAKNGIKLLGGTGEQVVDSAGKLTQAAQDLLFRISKKYVESYTERHGILKVLGMQKPVSLDSVYTTVQLLNPEALRTFASIEDLESVFRDNKVRGFQSQECPKQPGIEVANREQYLMVLGASGMGKTTFLRKVGLEALKRNKVDYQPKCIPVLLELKTFRTGKIDFKKAIAAEFANCGLPEYQQLTNKFLEQGKLLILFDGLDEVPTERMNEMVTAIQNFVDGHKNNRFITSCRIAAYRHNFRRFTDVAIADFDDQQIENFITNWFISNPERGQECLARLNSGDYQAAKELTQTPLLLTLVCILYQRSGQFPTNRSTLYERALRVLLEEWNGAKEIPIEQLYKGLDTKRKELILSQIAYDIFSEDQLFFPKRTIVKQIEQLLPELLPDEKFVDGDNVLRDIEVQHGLLVERAEGIYSFSHLTIQEFLTAQHIDHENLPIEPIVDQHLCNKRWREVFLLLAGLRKADNLLLAMEQKIHSLMNTPKLQELLTWVEKVTDKTQGEFHAVGKRAFVITNARSFALSRAFVRANAQASDYDLSENLFRIYDQAYKFAKIYAYSYISIYVNVQTFFFNNPQAQAYTYVFNHINSNAL
ncbi:MAG: NACHT domain-containing protein [Cyanobacteria bacterium P01_G01_bin.67]